MFVDLSRGGNGGGSYCFGADPVSVRVGIGVTSCLSSISFEAVDLIHKDTVCLRMLKMTCLLMKGMLDLAILAQIQCLNLGKNKNIYSASAI